MTTYEQRIAAFKSRHGIGRRSGKPPMLKRGYEAAKLTRLTADWNPSQSTGDNEIRFDLPSLRDRSRDGERSNAWINRALQVYEDNVLNDEDGFALKVKSTRPPDFTVLDPDANRKIEFAWKDWARMENCTEEGEDPLAEVLAISLRSCGRDGNMLIRIIVDPTVNQYGFTLKLLEIDYLDLNYTCTLPNGNYVIMGIEKNARGKRIAYHLLDRHPGDTIFGISGLYGKRIRVPASEIIHYFVKERSTQSIGVPWFAPAMFRLHLLDRYEIAEVTAAREAAEKGGFWTNERGQPYAGDPEFGIGQTGTEQTGTLNDYEPGQKDEMPAGWTFTAYDPKHPVDAFGDFVKAELLGAAAGMGISYMTLTGDLSQANYSSLRSGTLAEQRGFKKIQKHMIRQLVEPVFSRWLAAALLNGAINLPFSKYKIFNKPVFSGCRWPWVDPQKDVQALLLEHDAGLTTKSRIVAERDGGDLEEIYAELKYEDELADQYNLSFASDVSSNPLDSQSAAALDGSSNPSRNGRSKNLLTH